MTLPWGSTDTDRTYFEPDPHRHCPADVPCLHRADQDWRGTLAALDGVAGDSIYERMALEQSAYWDDWRDPA